MRAAIERDGVAAGLAAYTRFREEGDSVWNLAEYQLEHLARALVAEERHVAAVQVSRANAHAFPDSPIAQHYLAVALREAGDINGARSAFTRSIALDRSPFNASHAALAGLAR